VGQTLNDSPCIHLGDACGPLCDSPMEDGTGITTEISVVTCKACLRELHDGYEVIPDEADDDWDGEQLWVVSLRGDDLWRVFGVYTSKDRAEAVVSQVKTAGVDQVVTISELTMDGWPDDLPLIGPDV
jgi:hypothetical protein